MTFVVTQTPSGHNVKFRTPTSNDLAYAQAIGAGSGFTLEQTILALCIDQIDTQGFTKSNNPQDIYRPFSTLPIKDIISLTTAFSYRYLQPTQQEIQNTLTAMTELATEATDGQPRYNGNAPIHSEVVGALP